MKCANSKALESYQEKLRLQEESFDFFLKSIDGELSEIQELLQFIRKRALSYDGYNFSDEVKSLIVDLI